jgi:hypothetical protein
MKRNKSYKFWYVNGIKGNKLLSMYGVVSTCYMRKSFSIKTRFHFTFCIGVFGMEVDWWPIIHMLQSVLEVKR